MKMTPAEIVYKDMCSYLVKVSNKPHYPKTSRGSKLDKEDEFFFTGVHQREVKAIEAMIARQELRVDARRERLSHDSEGQSDEAQQDQVIPEDISLREEEEGENKVRAFSRRLHHFGSRSGTRH